MPSPQFHRLPPAQQDRIVQASLAAFARVGYDLASTNRIVEEAGISKGVLFKYFTDKEALFQYVIEVCTQSYCEGLPDPVNVDIFDWIRATTAYKLRYIKERPLIYQLFTRVVKDPAHPVHAKALRLQAEMVRRLGRDGPSWEFGPLRPGLVPEHVMNLVQWISAGLQEKFAASAPAMVDGDFDAAYHSLVAEFDIYLGILRSGLYGEGPSP